METIGQQLRAARERKKITLEAAAQATKIKSEHLAALEANQFENIEAPVYVKGFIKIYARFLGIEEKPLVDAFLRTVGDGTSLPLSATPPPPVAAQPAPRRPAAPTRTTPSPRPAPNAAPLAHPAIGKTASPPPAEESSAIPPGAIVAGLAGIIGLLIIIWAVSGFMRWASAPGTLARPAGTNVTAALAARTGGVVAAPLTVNPYLQPKNLSPGQVIEPPQSPAHTLTIRADEACTVTVTVDGAVWFRGRMPRNEVRKFDARRSIKVSTNNGHASTPGSTRRTSANSGARGSRSSGSGPRRGRGGGSSAGFFSRKSEC